VPSETHHVSALAALIEGVIRRESADGHDLNYSDIARRGTDVSRGNVRMYATKKLDRVIELEKRHGLALGLRVHPVLVDRAIAEDVGLMLEPAADDWRTDPDLTASDRKEIDAFIQGIKLRKARRHG
jgi:hypothetical protein